MGGWRFSPQSRPMKEYDNIVVGSGISGLTLALLLGMNGRSVLLIEKNDRIGGAMSRFYRKGIPFDTGFHFTGGLGEKGLLSDMLTVMGIHDQIEPIFIGDGKNYNLIFEDTGKVYSLPTGYSCFSETLKSYFPDDATGISRYFEKVRSICERTPAMDLRKIDSPQTVLDEDFISLETVLNDLTKDPHLKGVLSQYCMCHGVKPAEISFANHSRVSYSMYDSVARVKGGGDAFVHAIRAQLEKYNVDIRCNTYIDRCEDIKNREIGRFVLNSGEEVRSSQCVFTIHPLEIMKTFPRDALSKAFVNRVNQFEPSAGFFAVYGAVEKEQSEMALFQPTILSLFPTPDINQLLDPENATDSPLVIMRNIETVGRKTYEIVNALEVSFPEHVVKWQDSGVGHRPSAYTAYKQESIERIRRRIVDAYPSYEDSLEILDASSVLTTRDYLNTPFGSAYGVKQKIGQINLFGRLQFRNVYAAGQSAVLPGVLGAMMSSFIVGRSLLDNEQYHRFITGRLDRC